MIFNGKFGPELLSSIIKELPGQKKFYEGKVQTVVMDDTARKVFRSHINKTPEGDNLFEDTNKWDSIKRGVMGRCGDSHVMSARNIGYQYLYFYTENPFDYELIKGDSFVNKFKEVIRFDLLTNSWEPIL